MDVKGDYSEATMKNEVWQKDMTIIADFARELDCPTPLFAASAPIYNAAMPWGLERKTPAQCARCWNRWREILADARSAETSSIVQ